MDLGDTDVQLRFVASDFTVPTVKCNGTGPSAAFWDGLDGWTDNTVEQAGVDVICIQGPDGPIPQYYTFYEMYPNSPQGILGASPGDHINASVFYDSSTGKYNLVVTDSANSKVDLNVDESCPGGHTCHNSSDEVIAEDRTARQTR
jgi:Peptidase A4 family